MRSILLFVAIAATPACTPDGTCLEVDMIYDGDATGRVFVRSTSDTGSGLASYASVAAAREALAPSALSASYSCTGRDFALDEEWTVTAWVDVDGDEICEFDAADYDAECQPDANDPSDTRVVVVPHDEARTILLEITDP